MLEYPPLFYEYIEKASDKSLSEKERLHYLDLAYEVAKPLNDLLEKYGMVA